MKNFIVVSLALSFYAGKINSQAVGIGTVTPNSSAQLDVTSTSKGILVPRVNLISLADAGTIANPATSLLVYNTNAALTGGTGYFYNSGTPGAPVWVKLLTSSTAGWSIAGNAGTDNATNFIGTTDAKRLHFRVNNWPSGWIDYLGSGTTFFGFGAGKAYTFVSGAQSTGFGYNVMTNGIGARNVAMGASAMANNGTFGYYNVAIGFEAMLNNNDGNANVAIGNTAMHSNLNGSRNVMIGDSAMFTNTAGSDNVAVGANAYKNGAGSNNIAIGRLAMENSNASGNTAIGHSSMRQNASGGANTAVGYFALRGNNSSGSRNAVLGYQAMDANTTGERNVAMGYGVLGSNTSGSYNTALGYIALNSNISGANNVAVGSNALAGGNGSNNTAMGFAALENANYSSNNIAIGKSALNTMTYLNGGSFWSGDNVAIGVEALYSTNPTASSNLIPTNGITNVGVGNFALRNNSTGRSNTAVGHQSLSENTSGIFNTATGYLSLSKNTTGSSNVANGMQCLINNIDGHDNTGVGTGNLFSNTSGDYNTGLGQNALYANTTGSYNTAIGSGAGSLNNANIQCTFLGYDADQASGTNYTNSMALGYGARISASYQVRIGNTQITSIGGYQPWSNLSDGRFKKNITEQVKGLDFIMALRPVTYNLDMDKLSGYLEEDVYKDEHGIKQIRAVSMQTKNERAEQAKVIHSGFVAQEVEASAKKLNYDFSGVDKPKNADDLYALRYSEFVVPLVKAVQEQQQQIVELLKRIQQLEAMIKPAPGN